MNLPTSLISPSTAVEAEKPLAYAYSRFSTKEQAGGDSLRRQQTNAESWAADNNYRIQFLHDAGFSAYRGSNRTSGQFGEFVDALRQGTLGGSPVLLIENFDRMSREEIDVSQGLFLELVNRGATVVTLHNKKVYKRPLDLVSCITALVEMSLAHDESAKKAVRIKESWEGAKEAARKSKEILHRKNFAPIWLDVQGTWVEQRNRRRLINKKWIVREDRVNLIKDMFHRYVAGETPAIIAAAYNREGIRTWEQRGVKAKGWFPKSIKDFLGNRSLIGEYHLRKKHPLGRSKRAILTGEVIHDYFPKIIEPELWKQVENIRISRTFGPGKPSTRIENLFARFAFSGIDGTPMSFKGSGLCRGKTEYNYLVSQNHRLKKGEHLIRYEFVEARVLWLMRNIDPDCLLAPRAPTLGSSLAEQKENVQKRISLAERKRSKTMELLLDNEDSCSEPALRAKFKELDREIFAAKTEFEKLSRKVEHKIVPDTEDVITPEGRRHVRAQLALFCEKIVIHEDRIELYTESNGGIAVSLKGEPTCWAFSQRKPEEV